MADQNNPGGVARQMANAPKAANGGSTKPANGGTSPAPAKSDPASYFDTLFSKIVIAPIRGKNEPLTFGDGPQKGTVQYRLADIMLQLAGGKLYLRGGQVKALVAPGAEEAEIIVTMPKTGRGFQSKAVLEGLDGATDQAFERWQQERVLPAFLKWSEENKSEVAAIKLPSQGVRMSLSQLGIGTAAAKKNDEAPANDAA